MLEQLLDRLAHHRPPAMTQAAPEASVLVPVTDLRSHPEIILTRRAAHMNSHAGEVAFPGGKKDATDPDLLATALRESHEEIGLEPRRVQVLGQLSPLQSRAGIRVTPWVGLVPADVVLTPSPDELESIFRVPLAHFLDTRPASDHVVTWMGNEYLMPSYRYGDYVIWGLTAYIIVDLLNTVYDADIRLAGPVARARSAT